MNPAGHEVDYSKSWAMSAWDYTISFSLLLNMLNFFIIKRYEM